MAVQSGIVASFLIKPAVGLVVVCGVVAATGNTNGAIHVAQTVLGGVGFGSGAVGANAHLLSDGYNAAGAATQSYDGKKTSMQGFTYCVNNPTDPKCAAPPATPKAAPKTAPKKNGAAYVNPGKATVVNPAGMFKIS